MYDINWREKLLDLLINFTKESNSLQVKRDIIFILEAIVKTNETDIWKAIAYLYSETRQYDKAVETWNNIFEKDSDGDIILLTEQDFYIDYAKAADDATIIAGGSYDKSEGYFVQPTIIEVKDPHFKTMCEEIFGPVLPVLEVTKSPKPSALSITVRIRAT